MNEAIIKIDAEPFQQIEYYEGLYVDSEGVEYQFTIKHVVDDLYDELTWSVDIPDNEDEVRNQIGDKFNKR